MSETKKLTNRNEQIAAVLVNGERLKNFYRFVAQNPHINLHDACQIIIERPNATVCFSFNEWAAMGRRVTKGRKGIAYYDYDGYKQFVFDANDTHGDNRYSRPILPMKRLLGGLDELNGTEYAEEEISDYRKIHKGVELYLQEQDALTGDDERDKLLIDGIAYSLYSKTGFPKSVGIGFSGLPYSYKENAEFIKDVYIRADMLAQDIEEAYSENKEEIKIIDDTEEEAVSDEPVVSVKHTEQVLEKPNHPLYPMYEQYKKAQKTNPNAIVLMRYGDFYEAFDDSAKTLSKELDLTLTGRDFGLTERVPMCGMPYHAMDKYLNKILTFSGVLLIEPNEEPKYILSHAESLEQSEAPKEKQKPVFTEILADEPMPFDDEQSNNDEWRNELIAELGETNDEQSGDETEFENDNEDFDEVDDSDEQSDSIREQPKDKVKSTPKDKEKGIKDRKRKEKPQLSMFDLLNPQEKSRLEQIIETDLKYGSGIEHGKFRIFDKYNENPSEKAFAEFLKKEYGWGGRSGYGGICEDHSPKGVKIYLLGEKGENLEQTFLKWTEVANRIADLIDDDNYLSEQEKQKYVEYTTEQNRQKELRAEEERRKNELINQVIFFASADRKQRILDEYADTTMLTKFAEFLKTEYGTIEERGEEHSAIYNQQGIWIYRGEITYNYQDSIFLKWEEFADKVISLIEKDRYIEQPKLSSEEDETWDALIDARFSQPEEDAILEENENTDLNGVLDQTELGGAKTRFKNNVSAIRLVNKLYAENRNATEAEKKTLAQFVGWGGLSQAFDENNEGWKMEYAELKGLLSAEDYEQARSSTLNAYYTAKDVIGGIYTALERFGVKGNNRILEPSMGTGNFFGFMPKEIADGSRLYGVELDNLTGRIAAKLYPQANVQIKGFEDTSFPDDKFDVVVGNVPFGGYGVADSEYNRYNFRVHDYFLAKSIDKVKPSGIVAIVTSKGTMDKLNPSARKYVAERAELLGAIRLPNTAFKQTAGTEAVADILFFRKREEKLADISGEEWLGTGKTDDGYELNNYFIKHPEMVLGTLAEEIGLYGGKDITVKPDGRELSEALSEAVKNLPQDFYINPEAKPDEESTIEVDYNVKPMCFKAENGRLYMRIGDEMVEQRIPAFPKDAYQRICGMIALREELHHILDLQIQGCSDEVLKREQWKLNSQYDLFIKKYGELNGQTNTRLFSDDGDSALLFACEEIDKETGKVSKSDVFSKRTIRPYVVPTSTDDCFEALQISKNERGRVDISYIEELTGKSYDDVLFELGDAVFRNPEKVDIHDRYSGFETSEEYLSGKVVEKLNTARRYVEENPVYQANVEALEKVQPTPLTASEISVRLGQTWIDKEIYKQFYMELVGVYWWQRGKVELFYNPHDSSWRLDQKDSVRLDTQMKQKEVYGTKRAPAYRLFIDCMNLKATTIYDTVQDEDGKERRVLNQAETIAAREKQNKIKEEFQNWIFAKPERREELEATYNRLFNQITLPHYDGSYLKFPEMNPAIELRPHQKDAIHRIITNDQSTLLHHVVGSGKTYTMAASIMKMRQLGLCKKAMVAVPNHLVQQWASEWRKLYPNAKILVATKEDLEKSNRQKFVSKVALGDWDGIIIAQSSFAKIPVSQERQIKKLNEEIKQVEETIFNTWSEQGMPRGAVKNLEQIKKTKQAQLKKLMDSSKKDDVLTFENLGVDYLYIDEAHYYKNLFLYTKMNNVAGISSAASQRASDIKLKCEYLQELHGNDRGVVFATGTPISNSMTEMYTMQRYLQPSTLKEIGIEFFDGWAADFGETVTSMELAPSGKGYQARTRFAKFTNLPELQTLYRSFADVITSDMVQLAVPEAEKHVINLKPSDTVIELAEQIAERAEIIHDGGVKPEIDNMLKVTSDGKKLALDPRCFVPDSEDEEGSKLNEAARRIYEIWENTTDVKGTQIVFCDLSTPKVKSDEYTYGLRFDAYNDLKYKLAQKGIPSDEIAFIHDAHTDEQKQTLFDKVNSGTIRVLIGSTEKCGAGTNVQKRLLALHHLDTPYRPSDMEQREGRIIRQGNSNDKVDIYTYVMERTFDSYSYQILENKSRFIQQITRGDFTAREFEDIDETTLSYAEIKAITAANPRIKRKMEVDAEIARLRVLEGQYKKNLYSLQDKIRKDFPEDIRRQELLLERATLDLMHLQSSKPADPEAFEISVNGKVYTDKKEGGKALMDALYGCKPETVVAEYCGFKLSMNPMKSLTGERDITLAANGQYTMALGESTSGNLQRLDNFMEDFPKRKERLENRLQQLKNDLEIAKEQVKKPFEHRGKLSELLSEQAELNAELNLDKREESVVIDDGNGDSGENYKMLPTQRKSREEKIIDNEDKIAAMQVVVLPDYEVDIEDMHKYGYVWDGMLPLTRDKAARLWGMGLQVYKLGADNTLQEIEHYGNFGFDTKEKAMFGIEKPVWKRFLESEKALPYFAARSQFAESAGVVTSGDMDSIDERFTIDFIEANYKERADLDDYLADKPKPKPEEMKAYTVRLLDEFSLRIWRDELKYYGWEERDVLVALANHLENEEMKAEAKQLTDRPFNAEKELLSRLAGFSEQEIENMDLAAFDDELTVLDKQPPYMLNESSAVHRYMDGVLLLRNDTTRNSWYVINDTSAKNKDGSYIDKGDKTDVMTVLAYNGLYDGNPMREFYSEEEARAYYTEKIKAIRDVRLKSAKNNPLVVGGGSERDRIFAIIEDYCDSSERIHGGTEDGIDLELLANNADCSIGTTKELLLKYGASIDGNKVTLNDELQFERRVISNRPNYSDFVSNLRRSYFALRKQIDYESEVIESVKNEYDNFQAEMLKSKPKKVFHNSYKINLYNEFSEVIQSGKEYLSDNDFKALYEDKGHILDSLYDDYIGSENYSVETYGDTAMFIKDYCESAHNEIYYPITYYGKDTENRAYYSMTKGISLEDLVWFEKHTKADMLTVAAPACYVGKAELEKLHIFYLNIGRDISEEQLIGENTMGNMMNAMDNYQYIYPLYLKTGEYAHEHYEIIAHRNSRKSNMECKLAIEEAIRQNYDGMRLNDGIEDKLIEQYGMERVVFVLANTVNERNWDGRYSRENKDWARTIPMSEDENVRSECCLETHPAVLDAFINRIHRKIKEQGEKKKNSETPKATEKLETLVNGADSKTPVYYYFNSELLEGGKQQFQVYLLNYGDDDIYPFFENGFATQDELEQAWNDINENGIYSSIDFHKSEPQQMIRMKNQNREKKEQEMAQDKFKNFTARGDKVLSIIKDRDDRNIAIIQREKIGDFVVAARYDTTDGTWAQGKYDFKTLEDAEQYRTEKYGFENTSDTIDKKWLTCKVSPEALIKKYQFNSRFMMPKGSGYEGYAYSIFNDRIKEGTITTDLKSDTRERALVIRIPDNKNVEISGNGKTVEIDPHEFISLVNETTSDKYEREQRYTVGFPPEAFIKEYDTSMLVAMPNDTKYKGYVYYLPKSVITEDKHSDVGTLIANIGESFKVTLRKGEERIELTAKEYLELVGDKKADKYGRDTSEIDEYREQQSEDDKKWSTVAISENAVIANYQNSTLFKMPKGEYAGYVYYIPSGMVRKDENGLSLRVPEDFTAHLKDGDNKKDLSAQEIIAAIEGKTDEDYESIYRKPSEEAVKQFEKVEGNLRRNVPAEMLKKPNWVVVRTRENNDTGRLDKFLINPHTGKFAESDNPETWADFDTACNYAKENGGVCLAYALEWDNDIACIDLDGCMQENGDFSEIAEQTFNAAKGSYCERSVSGKGLHIFGKTKGSDLRSFSKDKTMEYYQGGHFIALTGDYYGSSELKSFDTPEMQSILTSKLEKRTEWKHTGEGIEGLSSMDDREMLEKAFAAKNGDTVKRLYNGEDVRGNHSNSDMSLMNYLAFWSNHDIDQMLRVFSSSGLYRADKPQSYYEHTAIKAVKGTPCYTPPKASNNKPCGNGSDSGNSK
jgi:N12 class adenine-specific DNA methylase